MGGEMRRAKSLRNGVHHAIAAVWEPVYRTYLKFSSSMTSTPRISKHEYPSFVSGGKTLW